MPSASFHFSYYVTDFTSPLYCLLVVPRSYFSFALYSSYRVVLLCCLVGHGNTMLGMRWCFFGELGVTWLFCMLLMYRSWSYKVLSAVSCWCQSIIESCCVHAREYPFSPGGISASMLSQPRPHRIRADCASSISLG